MNNTNNTKVIGFYRFDDYDAKKRTKNKVYCYVLKDKNGYISYKFTDDYEEAKNIVVRYAKDNGYNKLNIDDMLLDTNRFNYNCSSRVEVLNKIQKANKDVVINAKHFRFSYLSYLDEYNKKSLNIKDNNEPETSEEQIENEEQEISEGKEEKSEKAKEEGKTKKRGLFSRLKDFLGKNKQIKNFIFKATAIITAFAIGFVGGNGLKLSRSNGPTSQDSVVAITDDNDYKIDDIDKIVEDKTEKEEQNINDEEVDENENENEVINNNSDSNYSYSNISSSVTQKPGSVNSNGPSFQDPDVSLDDSNNGDSNESSDNTDDSLDNVIEEEVPDDNYNDDETNDNDYSEEIDVPVDDNDNASDDSLDKSDVDLDDELVGNEGAIDDDLSYDSTLDGDLSSLPDPNETANMDDGDYIITEDELQESGEQDFSVPVEQESTSTLEETIDVPVETATDLQPIDSEVVEQAVDAMANGENVNLVYDANTGAISFEEVPTIQDTNSLTK